jgi:AhpD family alkylhydroperoxidase
MDFALQHVGWEACLIEPRKDADLESYARRRQGLPSPSMRYFSAVPWLARSLVDMHPEQGLLIHADPAVCDLVALVVSQENSCRFCYAAVRAMLWAQGMDKARIERVEQDLLQASLPPRTAAAIVFGRAQSRSGPASARAACEALRAAGFSVDELKEIAYAVAVTDFSNRAHTIPAIPPQPLEKIPDQLVMRLVRPLVGRIFRKHRTRGQRTAQEPPLSNPYGGLVKAYAGSPIALLLARTLQDLWASPHLSRRCKLLMLAVIARGLACEGCAADLREALRAEGLTDAALERILTHLDGPELDPVERLLVPFARETIWYEPALLQRRARALREQLATEPLLEAIGVAALGNGLCRLGAVVMHAA